MTHVPAAPGTVILTLDDDGSTILRTPVVAFSVEGTLAYPIAPLAINGLLKAKRALLVDGFVIDRGFPIPFANEAEWLAWAGTQEAEQEPEVIDPADLSMGNDGQRGNETAQQMRARLQAENANIPHTDVTGRAANTTRIPDRPEKARKTFASKSFWAKTSTNGSTEIAEIEPGFGLPRDHEGWEKIKREEFAAFKRDSKGSDATVTVVTWGKDGPVEPEVQVEEQQEAEVVEDDTGLV